MGRQVGLPVAIMMVLPLSVGLGAVVGSSGSGFVVTPDGYILTNEHVIRGVGVITVYIGNSSYEATVVGVSEANDLALLKIAASNLAAAPLGNSLGVEPLESVVAIGYPMPGYGRDLTTSQGQITSIRTNVPGREGKETLQHDAVIYRGSSGGPLFNAYGEVIGVNFSGVVGTGLQFAVPINEATPLLRRIPGFNPRDMGTATEVIPASQIVLTRRSAVVLIEWTTARTGLRPSVPDEPVALPPVSIPNVTAGVSLIQPWILFSLFDFPDEDEIAPVLPLLRVGWLRWDDAGRLTEIWGYHIGLGVWFRYYGARGFVTGQGNWYWGWGTVLFIVPYLEIGVAWKFGSQDQGLVLHLGLWLIYPCLDLSIHF